MLVLTQTTDLIEIVLGGSVTTNQLKVTASWRDITTTAYTPGRTVSTTNNTTDVTIIGSPAASTQRVVDLINVYNSDTVSATVTVKYSDNGTEYILWRGVLTSSQTLTYTDADGWSLPMPTGGGGGGGVAVSGGANSQSTGTVIFSNSNNISFGLDGLGIMTASFAGGGLSAINVSAGTTSNNLTAFTMSNLNGVSFGLNGSVITGSHNGLTSQSNQAFSAPGGSSAFQTLVFANSQGVSWSNSNGSVVASVNTAYRNATDAVGLNTAQSNVTWTVNSSGLSLDARGYAGTGTSATNASVTLNSNGLAISVAPPGGSINVSAGTTSNNLTAMTFNNANGLSFGLNASTITGSYSTLPIATDVKDVGAAGSTGTAASYAPADHVHAGVVRIAAGSNLGNTAGNTQAKHGNWIIVGTNNITISGATGAVSNTLSVVGPTLTQYLTTARASNDAIGLNTAQSNVTWTVNSSGLSLDARGYAGTGTSATNASVTMNSNGLAINVAAPGGGVTNYTYMPPTVYGSGITQAIANGSMSFVPMPLYAELQFDNLMHQIYYTNAVNSSGALTITFFAGVYTRNASTLSLYGSSSSVFNIVNSGTQGIFSSIGGVRALPMGWTTTLTAGNYYMGIGLSTATASSNCSISQLVGVNQGSTVSGVFGLASNATQGMPLGWGRLTIATQQAPNSVLFADINQTASANRRALVFWMQSNTF